MTHHKSEIAANIPLFADDSAYPSCIQQQGACEAAGNCLGSRACPHSPMKFEGLTDEPPVPECPDELIDAQVHVGPLCLQEVVTVAQ